MSPSFHDDIDLVMAEDLLRKTDAILNTAERLAEQADALPCWRLIRRRTLRRQSDQLVAAARSIHAISGTVLNDLETRLLP